MNQKLKTELEKKGFFTRIPGHYSSTEHNVHISELGKDLRLADSEFLPIIENPTEEQICEYIKKLKK